MKPSKKKKPSGPVCIPNMLLKYLQGVHQVIYKLFMLMWRTKLKACKESQTGLLYKRETNMNWEVGGQKQDTRLCSCSSLVVQFLHMQPVSPHKDSSWPESGVTLSAIYLLPVVLSPGAACQCPAQTKQSW